MLVNMSSQALLVAAPPVPGADVILSDDALAFLGGLCAEFSGPIEALLGRRVEAQAAFDAGGHPDFLEATAAIRESDWRVAPIPADLRRRTVEITGPVDAKMIINALNSGADVFMADCEDSSAPTWSNVVAGHLALYEAVRGTLTFTDDARGKHYALNPEADARATLLVRPRGLHLPEAHLVLDGRPVPAALVDFGLYLFHNAAELLARGTGPYFYLPKLQSHREAQLWNQVFVYAQDQLGIPQGSIRATVLIETLPAVFEMHEILWALRDHSAGLNCGRWDYIFSYIKTFRAHPDKLVPDRAQVGMTQPFMAAYTKLLVETCHRRGIHAMGGMAAQIPRRDDPEANASALAKVAADKRREALGGHDGTWVAHPGLIAIAREAFAEVTTADNQIDVPRDPVTVRAADLCAPPTGTRTEAGLRLNVRVGVQYIEAWLGGNGCVPLYWLMEDAATAEISRAQVWQWRRHAVALEDGRTVDDALIRELIADEMQTIRREIGDARFEAGRFDLARELFTSLVLADELDDFLTLSAYPHLDV